jgi:hypothetical protein
MSAIIPFDAPLPATRNPSRLAAINRDVLGAGGTQYPVLSIKGKVFTLVKGSEKKVITREIDGEDEPVSSLQVAMVRANTKYRVFYAAAYSEGESDGKKPTCFSHDGITPDLNAAEPQSKKCQGCPQNVWGVRDGKGTACSSKTRLAVVDPNNVGEPLLLNVPPASRKSFAQAVEAADARGRGYNEMVVRVSFDKDAPSPKLIFKPVGWLPDEVVARVDALYDDEVVQEMVGVPSAHREAPAEPAVPSVVADDIEAALGARKAVAKAAASAKPALAAPAVEVDEIDEIVKPKAAPAKKAAAKTVAAAVEDTDSLLADMDALLGNKDD